MTNDLSTDAVDGVESPNRGKDHSTPRPLGGSADAPGVPALSASIAHLEPPAWYMARAEGWLDEAIEQGWQA